MKVCVVGTGYVGLVTGACLAEIGHTVTCVDKDKDKIRDIVLSLEAPFYEPILNDIIRETFERGDLMFSSDLKDCLAEKPEVVFVCVGTPDDGGRLSLRYIIEVCRDIAESECQAQVVIKSTVPPGTCTMMRDMIDQIRIERDQYFLKDVISNPEFLKEGHAVEDFRRPDRIVVGARTTDGFAVMRDLYSHFIRNGHNYLEMHPESSEMTKLTANSMLATRISFMNEIAGICENVGADIMDVRRGIGSDSRIGMQFLYPGIGFGGSCFPKDVVQMSTLTDKIGLESLILNAVLDANTKARVSFTDKIIESHTGSMKPAIAIWGLSFKPKTDDIREAPAIKIIYDLLDHAGEIRVYDPVVEDIPVSMNRLVHCPTKYEACIGADALVLCTEWAEFRKVDWHKIKSLMKTPKVFDGRNQWDPEELRRLGFEYVGVGRGSSPA